MSLPGRASPRTGGASRGYEVEPRDRKTALRRSVRDARRSLSGHERREASEAISSRIRLLPELLTTRVVLVYAASPYEVDVEVAANHLRSRGVHTLYPRVRGDDLDLVPVARLDELVDGHRGIREPRGPAADPAIVDAVLVPGVAFDLRGRRLGQGGGHYDRLLPQIDDALRIGVAFTCQIVPQVPMDDHDIEMDLLVTERSVHRFGRAEPA
jgi:5-formyltetrahydrofolate cyclo-ligase